MATREIVYVPVPVIVWPGFGVSLPEKVGVRFTCPLLSECWVIARLHRGSYFAVEWSKRLPSGVPMWQWPELVVWETWWGHTEACLALVLVDGEPHCWTGMIPPVKGKVLWPPLRAGEWPRRRIVH